MLVDGHDPGRQLTFAATLAEPLGVTYRGRYQWSGGRIVDIGHAVFADGKNVVSRVSPGGQSAFVSRLAGARTGRTNSCEKLARVRLATVLTAGVQG